MHDHNTMRLVRYKMMSIFKSSFRRVIASGATESNVCIFGGNSVVIERLIACKKVYQALMGALLPAKKAGKGKNKDSNPKKGSSKNRQLKDPKVKARSLARVGLMRPSTMTIRKGVRALWS